MKGFEKIQIKRLSGSRWSEEYNRIPRHAKEYERNTKGIPKIIQEEYDRNTKEYENNTKEYERNAREYERDKREM